MIPVKKPFFWEISANERFCILSRFALNVTSQETNICRIFQKHLRWRDWMVTRNHYAQSEMITVKKRFFRKFLRIEGLCIVSRLHLNVTSQETSICRLFEKHSCWWDWMVTRNQYAQSEMITVKSLFFLEISANEGCCLHSSVASQVSQHLSSFQE